MGTVFRIPVTANGNPEYGAAILPNLKSVFRDGRILCIKACADYQRLRHVIFSNHIKTVPPGILNHGNKIFNPFVIA